MKNSQEIAQTIKNMAKNQKVSISKIITDCGLNKNALFTMQSGYYPRLETLVTIADYLDCSVDYLLGRDIKKGAPDSIRDAIIARVMELPDDRLDRLLGFLEGLVAE